MTLVLFSNVALIILGETMSWPALSCVEILFGLVSVSGIGEYPNQGTHTHIGFKNVVSVYPYKML